MLQPICRCGIKYTSQMTTNEYNTEQLSDILFTFSVNEIVLCFHGPLLYEAKILKSELWDSSKGNSGHGPHYYIHYKGWSEKWDEWVPETRVKKNTEENQQKQKNLSGLIEAIKKNKNEQNSYSESSKKTIVQKRTKKKNTRNHSNRLLSSVPIVDFKVSLPIYLKAILVDDWENITRNNQLISLPHRISISQVLMDYQSSINDNKELVIAKEICYNIKEYFNLALGKLLLYTFERFQYKQILTQYPNMKMVDIYGPQHLLRLFVKFPSLFVSISESKESIKVLELYFDKMVEFISECSTELFKHQDYDNATPEYITRSHNG